jgi:hypothetical protein
MCFDHICAQSLLFVRHARIDLACIYIPNEMSISGIRFDISTSMYMLLLQYRAVHYIYHLENGVLKLRIQFSISL